MSVRRQPRGMRARHSPLLAPPAHEKIDVTCTFLRLLSIVPLYPPCPVLKAVQGYLAHKKISIPPGPPYNSWYSPTVVS